MPRQTAFALPAPRNWLAIWMTVSPPVAKLKCISPVAAFRSIANGVEIDPNGRLLVAATVGMLHGSCFGLARLLEDGSADLSFGTNGGVIGQFQRGHEAMARQSPCLVAGIFW